MTRIIHGRPGIYNASGITLSDGEGAALALDSSGRVLIAQGTASNLNAQVTGNVASGSADSGNPVKVGGKYNAAPPTFADGQRGDLQLDASGNLRIVSAGATGSAVPASALYIAGSDSVNLRALLTAAALGDGASANGILTMARYAYNGATYDRIRPNIDTGALITASGVTTTQTGADQTNYNGRGVKVVLDMTVVGTGSVTLEIDGKDTASGKYYPILTGAAVITNVTNVYEIGPGLPATANVSANAQLPRTWRVKVTANNANATTYTVGASVIV